MRDESRILSGSWTQCGVEFSLRNQAVAFDFHPLRVGNECPDLRDRTLEKKAWLGVSNIADLRERQCFERRTASQASHTRKQSGA